MVAFLISFQSLDCVGEASLITRRSQSFQKLGIVVHVLSVQKLCQATACGLEKCCGQILLQMEQFFLLEEEEARQSSGLKKAGKELNQQLSKVSMYIPM